MKLGDFVDLENLDSIMSNLGCDTIGEGVLLKKSVLECRDVKEAINILYSHFEKLDGYGREYVDSLVQSRDPKLIDTGIAYLVSLFVMMQSLGYVTMKNVLGDKLAESSFYYFSKSINSAFQFPNFNGLRNHILERNSSFGSAVVARRVPEMKEGRHIFPLCYNSDEINSVICSAKKTIGGVEGSAFYGLTTRLFLNGKRLGELDRYFLGPFLIGAQYSDFPNIPEEERIDFKYVAPLNNSPPIVDVRRFYSGEKLEVRIF